VAVRGTGVQGGPLEKGFGLSYLYVMSGGTAGAPEKDQHQTRRRRVLVYLQRKSN
jgi:hypothetical protein